MSTTAMPAYGASSVRKSTRSERPSTVRLTSRNWRSSSHANRPHMISVSTASRHFIQAGSSAWITGGQGFG